MIRILGELATIVLCPAGPTEGVYSPDKPVTFR